MHIAYLTPEYPHERTGTSGGMGTSIKNLVSELVKKRVYKSRQLVIRQIDSLFVDSEDRVEARECGWYSVEGPRASEGQIFVS